MKALIDDFLDNKAVARLGRGAEVEVDEAIQGAGYGLGMWPDRLVLVNRTGTDFTLLEALAATPDP